jgi:quercetin dioxygenase-like cupin family protein
MSEQKKTPVVHVARADEAFETGLRSDFEYRLLGARRTTAGEFIAQHIRVTPGDHDFDTTPHKHDTGFHLIYMLEGEVTFWFDGRGDVTFKKGDSWCQNYGVAHALQSCSADAEFLEVATPGDFETVLNP